MPPSWLDITILSIVEGITEFLPISSTGHMIIAREFLKVPSSEELDAFLVVVQVGAILAVVSAFWKTFWGWFLAWLRFLPGTTGKEGDSSERYQSICTVLAVVPAGVLGLLLRKHIVFSVSVVAWALIVGGVLIWGAEFLLPKLKRPEKQLGQFGLRDALLIGCGQCLALWPGFSRSAATIITGRIVGYPQVVAAQISFLIGLPTLAGAASFELVKAFPKLHGIWFAYLGYGIVLSWIVAFIFVKGFIGFLQRYKLTVFAHYRVVAGLVLLIWFRHA